MARCKKPSMTKQVEQRFKEMTAYGQSKHADRQDGGQAATKGKIYSYSTFQNYMDAGAKFANWAKAEHGCRDLDSARQYAGEYLAWRRDGDANDEAKSAWTVARDAAALAKLYGCSSSDLGCDLPSRHREDVTQHREHKWAGHFSEERNADLVAICKATGLRRHEIAALKPSDVREENGTVIVHVAQGKGGRSRDVECLSDAPLRLAQAAEAAGQEHVIEHISKYAPCHEYRREYAQELYDRYERDESELTAKDIYYCRGDMAGQRYDKAAMRHVSRSLGHERLEVVTHYLSHSGLTETETVTETEEVEEEADD